MIFLLYYFFIGKSYVFLCYNKYFILCRKCKSVLKITHVINRGIGIILISNTIDEYPSKDRPGSRDLLDGW